MEPIRNGLKAALARGETQLGVWLSLADPSVAEIAGLAGFDWCLIDGEHGPNAPTGITGQLQALGATGTQAAVRVAANDPVALKQVLDLGVQTVVIPMIDTPAQAAAAVAACRYPPTGTRGMGAMVARAGRWGAIEGYAAHADREICVLVQAESVAAFENMADIAAIDGVDGVFIGPADLSGDMGLPGQTSHPEVRAVIEAGITTIRQAGKAPAIFAFDPEDIAHWGRLGVQLIALGADGSLLLRALRETLARGRAATGTA